MISIGIFNSKTALRLCSFFTQAKRRRSLWVARRQKHPKCCEPNTMGSLPDRLAYESGSWQSTQAMWRTPLDQAFVLAWTKVCWLQTCLDRISCFFEWSFAIQRFWRPTSKWNFLFLWESSCFKAGGKTWYILLLKSISKMGWKHIVSWAERVLIMADTKLSQRRLDAHHQLRAPAKKSLLGISYHKHTTQTPAVRYCG